MYGEEFVGLPGVPSSNAFLTGINLAAAAGDYGLLYVGETIVVTRLELLVTTAVVAGTTAPQVGFYARPTIGSASGQVLIGTLTIPNATAAGQILYKNVESAKIPAGYTIAVTKAVQAADGGTAAGVGAVQMKGFYSVEDPRNNALMVASA